MSLSSISEGSSVGWKKIFIMLSGEEDWEIPWQYFAVPLTVISVPWDYSNAVDILYWHCHMSCSADRKCHLLLLSLSLGQGIFSMSVTRGKLQWPIGIEDIRFLHMFAIFFTHIMIVRGCRIGAWMLTLRLNKSQPFIIACTKSTECRSL